MRCQKRKKTDLKEFLLQWDSTAEMGGISPNDVDKRNKALLELDQLEQEDRNVLKQRATILWAVEGDESTKFFHSYIQNKYKKQNLYGLNYNGSWREDPQSIKDAAFYHFKSRFTESCRSVPFYAARSSGISQQGTTVSWSLLLLWRRLKLRFGVVVVQRPRSRRLHF